VTEVGRLIFEEELEVTPAGSRLDAGYLVLVPSDLFKMATFDFSSHLLVLETAADNCRHLFTAGFETPFT
jgi:hypothetical protein